MLILLILLPVAIELSWGDSINVKQWKYEIGLMELNTLLLRLQRFWKLFTMIFLLIIMPGLHRSTIKFPLDYVMTANKSSSPLVWQDHFNFKKSSKLIISWRRAATGSFTVWWYQSINRVIPGFSMHFGEKRILHSLLGETVNRSMA